MGLPVTGHSQGLLIPVISFLQGSPFLLVEEGSHAISGTAGVSVCWVLLFIEDETGLHPSPTARTAWMKRHKMHSYVQVNITDYEVIGYWSMYYRS